ncbi:fasciclin domain-containing protein [Hufsiella ginkgonis]|uniref:FAS1 domain-containing protein n=1 Tax=Hufsiella ginkgonis TaxID=2695274 RepID=A0A7K1Y303_9SPHI|nr:fasciclin domain-containing protein [Hufsiella ginkgonis]MXV17665.1 hypothetical protein [Hufsiella ginkgonis]
MAVILFISCEEYRLDTGQTLEKNSKTILNYLKENPKYSILVKALEITRLSEPLSIYGSMTLFAPNDEAFKKYLKRKNVADVSELKPDTLKNLLQYHIYNEQYGSANFVMGTLPTSTINGNFIKFDISAGIAQTKLNDAVTLGTLDVLNSNGFIHEVNDVLDPPAVTLYGWLKSQARYSIMLEAFEKTGNADDILKKIDTDPADVRYGKPVVKWRTIFLETNDVLKKAGINSFDDLAKKYSNTYKTTKNYTSLADSLNLFVRFHALNQKYFVSEFSDTYKESFSAGNYLIFGSSKGISINKHADEVTGADVQVGIDLANSNNITQNGVLHSITSVMSLYKVRPVTVIQPFAGSLEDRSLKLKTGLLSNFITEFPKLGADPAGQSIIWWLKWGYPVGTPSVPARAEWAGDYAVYLTGATQGYYYEVTTPLVFKGTYNVIVNYSGYRRNNPANASYASFKWDGQQLGDVVTLNLTDSNDAIGGSTVGPTPPGVTTQYGDFQFRRYIGKVTLNQTSSHVLRIDGLAGTNTQIWWYSVELVPVN